MSPTNRGAFITATGTPLSVRSAPFPTPSSNELIIQNKAIALNPVDYILRDQPRMGFPWIQLPFISGSDISGIVHSVGNAVTRFKPGDRVLAHAIGGDKARSGNPEGGFQEYTLVVEHMTSSIPDAMGFEQAAVIPLGCSTAACGLFQKDFLDLSLPKLDAQSQGKTVLVWGASTSVGCNAVQLAVAAGYEVFATSSPRNFEYVKQLGASKVFDYNSSTCVKDLIAAFRGRKTAGALSIGPSAAEKCLDILGQCEGDRRLAMISYPVPPKEPKRFVVPTMAYYFLAGKARVATKSWRIGARSDYVFGSSLWDNGVGKAVYQDWMPGALRRGIQSGSGKGGFVPSPRGEVVGQGVESIQYGLEKLKGGVSCKKIVVRL